MARTITAIPATRRLHTGTPLGQTTIRKVAGYARVSTDHDDHAAFFGGGQNNVPGHHN